MAFGILCYLPYFDPIRFVAIDPMHNLYLGTGKHLFKLWIALGLLSSEQLIELEERIRSFHLPPDVGRLPSNISSNYGGYTASQWHNWITIYSAVVLKGILVEEHLLCWLLFVRACFILSKRVVTNEEVDTADLYVLNFCKRFEHLYGKQYFTPNQHLHMHLKQCLLDFGPSHSFWCFAFERCNGLLGSYPTNKKAIEIQVMRKFCDSQSVRTLTPQVDVDFKIVLPVSYNATDSASPFVFNDDISIHSLLSMSHSPLHSIKSFENSGVVTLLPPFREDVLGFEEVSNLAVIYQQLYPEKQIEKDDLSRFYLRSK